MIDKWWPEGNPHDNNREISGTTVHYIVMESGNHWLAKSKLKVEARNFEDSATGKVTFTKNWFDDTPLVFMQSQSYSGANLPVVTRINWLTKDKFTWYANSVKKLADHLEKDWWVEEAYQGSLKMGYIAIEAGDGNVSGVDYTFDKVKGTVNYITEEDPLEVELSSLDTETPIFIAASQEISPIGYLDNNGKQGWIERTSSELRFCYSPGFQGVKLASEDYLIGLFDHCWKETMDNVAYLGFEGEANIYAWKNLRNPMVMQIDEENANCTIIGYVFDSLREEGKQGLVGALVVIKETGQWREITDEATGKFIFTNLSYQNYTLAVSRTGYLDYETTICFDEDGEGNEPTRQSGSGGTINYANVTITLTPDGWIVENVGECWWDGAPKYLTELEIIGIYCENDNGDKQGDDEVYVIADNVRYPHPWDESLDDLWKRIVSNEPKSEEYYNYLIDNEGLHEYVMYNEGLSESTFELVENTIASRVSIEPDCHFQCEISVWEDDSTWTNPLDINDGEQQWEGDDDFMFEHRLNFEGNEKDSSDGEEWGTYYALYFEYNPILYYSREKVERVVKDLTQKSYVIILRARTTLCTDLMSIPEDEGNQSMGPNDDWDSDGLSNIIEYDLSIHPYLFNISYGYAGLANPREKDIFLELDSMDGVNVPIESKVKAATKFAEEGIRLHIDDGCLGGGESNIDRGIGNFFRPEIGFENMPSSLFHYSRRSTFSYCFFQDTMEQDDPLYDQRDQANGVSLGEKSFCMPVLDCTPQQVAYRLGRYLAIHSLPNIHSSDSDGDGLNDFVEEWYGSRINHGDTDGDGLGDALEVELFKDPTNHYDIHGFDLTISFLFDKDDYLNISGDIFQVREIIESLEKGMKSTSNLLFALTDGYFFINSITIWDRAREWYNAGIRLTQECDSTKPHTHFDLDAGAPLYIHLLCNEEMKRGESEKYIACHEEYYVNYIGHELGHYLFWLGEEYEDYKEKQYVEYVDNENNFLPSEDLDRIWLKSIMNEHDASEFSTYLDYYGPGGWLNNRDSLEVKHGITIYNTDQYHKNDKESCWETIFRMTNRIDGYNELIDFDLNIDGQADSDYYYSYVNHEGPTYDIGQYMKIYPKYLED